MMNSKLFVGASNGRLYERFWNGSQWVWVGLGVAGAHDAEQLPRISTPAPGSVMQEVTRRHRWASR